MLAMGYEEALVTRLAERPQWLNRRQARLEGAQPSQNVVRCPVVSIAMEMLMANGTMSLQNLPHTLGS